MMAIKALSKEEDSGSNTLSVHQGKGKQSERSAEDEGQQLLPGILDDITIHHIAPKLPWTAFHRLSSVSRGWQHAIQSHQIYEARVQSQSTQTLVALLHRYLNNFKDTVSLCSSKDGSCHHLPLVPGFVSGFPVSFKCVSLDGKLYILGGLEVSTTSSSRSQASADVYVLDLAGQRPWRQLASMKDPRMEFGCGVINGKIYVFGGTSNLEPVCGSEVYDPKENVWSSITPMASFRSLHNVTTLGEELFVHSGEVFHPDFFERTRKVPLHLDPLFHEIVREAFSAEIYHPLKDEWRTVEHFTRTCMELVVPVQGKLHKVTQRGIDVYDIHANSWEPSQSFLFDELNSSDSFLVWPFAVVPVDGELLAIVGWQNTNARHPEPSYGKCLMRSRGCGGESKEVVWQILQCSLPLGNLSSFCMCAIQL